MFRTARFPVYRQLDQMDCGPTCLKIIADYYGKDFPLDYLRQISSQQKGGVSLAGLSEALGKIGMSSLGIKASFPELVKEVPLPLIAHWEGNHFLVVFRTSRKFIFVSDPALGLMKYTHKEFLEKWSGQGNNEGVLLLVEPNENFFNSKGREMPNKGIGFLFSYLKPFSKYINQILLGLFIASVIQLMLPFLTQSLVDQGINYGNLKFIHLVVIAQLMLFITLSVTEIIRDQVLLHISTKINIRMISDFLYKLLLMPISYFDSKTTGDFMQRINDHSRIDEFLGGRFLTILFDLFSIVAFGVVLSLFNTKVFVIFLFGTVLFFTWSLMFMRRKEILDHQLFNAQQQEQSIFLQIFRAVQEIKLNSSEFRRKNEWEGIQKNLFRLRSRFLKVDQYQVNGGRFIKEMMQIFIIFWSAKAIVSGDMSLGTMLAIQFIVGSLSLPIANSIDFLVGFQRAKLSFDRLTEIHDQPSEDPIQDSSDTFKPGGIEVREASFGYGNKGAGLILREISVSIPPGKITAIVGPSGSGKTTLLKVLLKLYKCQSGTIKVENRDFRDIDSDHWRRGCGAVLQDGVIFNDTIERNITESKSDLPTEFNQLERAIKVANLSDLLASLPLGYNTKIGEQGLQLSGGEKQRILIARAVYKDPHYLFFDEATSSLDAENEKVITENLNTVYKNKTVLIIAHRLSTVKNADQILVMDKGRIVEEGTHSELILLNGLYHRLISNQL